MYTLMEAKEELLEAFVSYKPKELGYVWNILDERFHLPFCLVAPEGTGKRSIVKAVAEEMNVPFFEDEIPASEVDKVGILYLETNGFPLLEKRIVYPKNWLVVLGLTPNEYDFEIELGNIKKEIRKMRIIKITPSLKEFLSYLEEEHEETIIAEYLKENPDMAYVYKAYVLDPMLVEEKSDAYVSVTYRDWDNLGRVMEYRKVCGGVIDLKFISQFIKNKEVALHFADYYKKSLAKEELEKLHYMLKKSGGFAELVESYIESSNEERYSLASAMTVYLEKKAAGLKKVKQELECAERIQRYIAGKEETFYVSMLFGKFGESFVDEMMQEYPDFNIAENEKMIFETILNQWYSTEDFEIAEWFEKKRSDLNEEMLDISRSIETFMEFFEYVDRTEYGYKKVIYDFVSNNVELLKSVSMYECEPYNKMTNLTTFAM